MVLFKVSPRMEKCDEFMKCVLNRLAKITEYFCEIGLIRIITYWWVSNKWTTLMWFVYVCDANQLLTVNRLLSLCYMHSLPFWQDKQAFPYIKDRTGSKIHEQIKYRCPNHQQNTVASLTWVDHTWLDWRRGWATCWWNWTEHWANR